MKRVLTGIKPTGEIHLGNYLGAIRPALIRANSTEYESFLFIADYHSLTTMHKGEELNRAIYHIAAAWLACGLDPNKTVLYKQSDVPEIFELTWVLSCFTPKGFMNRAHAYKAKVSANAQAGKSDLDSGVNMGLFNYPVLMSADILAFQADEVPVGEDQVQHVEFARDMAQKFNNNYGELIKVPQPIIESEMLVPGLDGRKMSKSYSNTIPIFETEKKFRKLVMKIKTDSLPPEAAKNPKDSLIFQLYKEFASEQQLSELAARYQQGIGWGDAKQVLYEKLMDYFQPIRDKYFSLIERPNDIDDILIEGAKKARNVARPLLDDIRISVGVKR